MSDAVTAARVSEAGGLGPGASDRISGIAPCPGERFGEHVIGERLHAQGAVEVCRAWPEGRQHEALTLQRLSASHEGELDCVDALLDVADVLQSLCHPNLLRVRELGWAGDAPYLRCDAVRGMSASALIEAYRAGGHAMSVAVACELGRQLCDVLAYVHVAGAERTGALAHGGVSLSSVFVTREGTVTLIGLGCAEPGEHDDADDARDAALFVTELLGGRAAALSLVPASLAAALESAIVGPRRFEAEVTVSDLARELAAEAASSREAFAELRLVLPTETLRPSRPAPVGDALAEAAAVLDALEPVTAVSTLTTVQRPSRRVSRPSRSVVRLPAPPRLPSGVRAPMAASVPAVRPFAAHAIFEPWVSPARRALVLRWSDRARTALAMLGALLIAAIRY